MGGGRFGRFREFLGRVEWEGGGFGRFWEFLGRVEWEGGGLGDFGNFWAELNGRGEVLGDFVEESEGVSSLIISSEGQVAFSLTQGTNQPYPPASSSTVAGVALCFLYSAVKDSWHP